LLIAMRIIVDGRNCLLLSHDSEGRISSLMYHSRKILKPYWVHWLRRMKSFTRAVYETGARAEAVWNLKWIDVDFQNQMVNINKPENGSRARRLKISSQIVGLISSLAFITR
jgi:integrase